ncbi:MAG: segregation/condensation protein A [Gammaproteobacteria bacterium]|nr:segregation/condensation protein A [Gammaproteobacteria bacterium]MCF6229927.1 segregation/condensation protein A [Gammaproteobacteria bacterium]
MNSLVAPPAEALLAKVNGKPVVRLPKGLFIPPDALEVFLETFEGPLDLLIYLIRSHNLDILNIPIAEVTRQYMKYVALMEAIDLTLAADYLVMAAMLAEIKSRMLLPPAAQSEAQDEVDPRAELVQRLQAYERYKKAAEALDQLPRMERDTFEVKIDLPPLQQQKQHPEVELKSILLAFRDVVQRTAHTTHHTIERERLSVRERMNAILARVTPHSFTAFSELFQQGEGRGGLIVTLLAILELHKEQLIEVVQVEPYENIHVKGIA